MTVLFVGFFAAINIIGLRVFGKNWFGETDSVFIDTFQIKEVEDLPKEKSLNDEIDDYLREKLKAQKKS